MFILLEIDQVLVLDKGDPLCRYQFILDMEELSRMLSSAMFVGNVEVVCVARFCTIYFSFTFCR